MQMVEPPIPKWLNNALFSASFTLIVTASIMLVILQIHQRSTKGVEIFGFDVRESIARIVNYRYWILFSVVATAFIAGLVIFPSKSDDLGKRTPLATTQFENKIVSQETPDHKALVKTPDVSTTRVLSPRTPKELMDIVISKTKRDAMRHKGSWIQVEGTVRNISETKDSWLGVTKKPSIEVEVLVGWIPNNVFPQTAKLYLGADRWKSQIDKIGRDDRLVAHGVVHNINKLHIQVIDAEIISVSGMNVNE